MKNPQRKDQPMPKIPQERLYQVRVSKGKHPHRLCDESEIKNLADNRRRVIVGRSGSKWLDPSRINPIMTDKRCACARRSYKASLNRASWEDKPIDNSKAAIKRACLRYEAGMFLARKNYFRRKRRMKILPTTDETIANAIKQIKKNNRQLGIN